MAGQGRDSISERYRIAVVDTISTSSKDKHLQTPRLTVLSPPLGSWYTEGSGRKGSSSLSTKEIRYNLGLGGRLDLALARVTLRGDTGDGVGFLCL